MISKRSFLAALLVAGLAVSPRTAGACSCTGEPSFDLAVSSSRQIFRGTVLDVRSAEPEHSYMVWATLVVERAWKGTPGDTTSILTGQDDGICGFHFVPGETYLVYAQAYGAGDIMFTHSCSRSHEAWAGDPDPAALDAVTPVRGRTWGALKLHYR